VVVGRWLVAGSALAVVLPLALIPAAAGNAAGGDGFTAQGGLSPAGPGAPAVPPALGQVVDEALARDGVPQLKLTASDGAAQARFGRSVAVQGDTAVIGAILADVDGNAAQGAAYVFVRGDGGWTERQKLTASDGTAFERFGGSLALDGDTLLVGTWGASAERGAVYVFVRDGSGWTEQAKLTAPDAAQNDLFGEYVAIDGDTAVIGAPGVDGAGASFEQGAAYVSTRTGASWSEPSRLPVTGGERGDQSGHGVAIAGDTAFVGVPFAEVGSNFDQGAVDLFARDGEAWEPAGRLSAADGAGIDRFGFSVAAAGDTVAVGAIGAGSSAPGTGAVYVFTSDGGAWNQQAKLGAVDGAPFDNFGNAVALAGDRLVAGADFATVGDNTWQGAAYVYARDGGVWTHLAKLVANDGAPFDGFSGNAVAIDDHTVLAGAQGATVDDHDVQGAAYLFPVTDSGGVRLTAPDGAADDWFGRAVAIDGDTALVGADGADIAGTANLGAVYVFVRDGAGWVEQAKLTGSDVTVFDQFGISVALSGDTAVVGGGSGINAAYVFTRTGQTWRQQAKLTASDDTGADLFGIDVAVSGDTVLVGAREADVDGNPNQGAAYVFTRTGQAWREQARLTASDGAAFDVFGDAVAIDGGTAVVGAAFADPGGTDGGGAAWVFTHDGGAWHEQAKLTASDAGSGDWFGGSVAVSGQTALIGASLDDDGRGAAYAFTRDGASWTEQAKLVAVDGAAGDNFGNAVTIAGNAAVVGAWIDDAARGAAYLFTRDGDAWSEQEKLVPAGIAENDQFGDAVALHGGTVVAGAWLSDIAGRPDQGAAFVYEVDVPHPPEPPPAACDETIVGTHAGALTVSEGVTCLAAGARVLGEVNVLAGAGLVGTAAVVRGPVSAFGASVVELRFSQVTGPVLVSGATGSVSLFASQVTGSVSLLGGSGVSAVAGNTVIGSLSCFGNEPAPVDHGLPNTATGGKLGQCATL
jgi:hypothetical protein